MRLLTQTSVCGGAPGMDTTPEATVPDGGRQGAPGGGLRGTPRVVALGPPVAPPVSTLSQGLDQEDGQGHEGKETEGPDGAPDDDHLLAVLAVQTAPPGPVGAAQVGHL